MTETEIPEAVLFVDDEENILKSIQRGLIDQTFPQRFARSGPAALTIMEKEAIAVIVTDMRMPEMEGLELLAIVKDKYPETVRIILTGYTHVYTIISAVNTGQIYRYLIKPWKMEAEFIPTIHQAIEYHRLLMERKNMIADLKKKNLQLNKQNVEIQILMNRQKESETRKKEIIRHFTQEVVPDISGIIAQFSSFWKGSQTRPAHELNEDFLALSRQWEKIQLLLNRIVTLLKDPE
jgi:two-component system, NtrC family, response regulator HupR/HoxA